MIVILYVYKVISVFRFRTVGLYHTAMKFMVDIDMYQICLTSVGTDNHNSMCVCYSKLLNINRNMNIHTKNTYLESICTSKASKFNLGNHSFGLAGNAF